MTIPREVMVLSYSLIEGTAATGQGRHQGTFEVVQIDHPQLSEHACFIVAVAVFGSVGAETAKKWLDQVMMEI